MGAFSWDAAGALPKAAGALPERSWRCSGPSRRRLPSAFRPEEEEEAEEEEEEEEEEKEEEQQQQQ